MGALYCGGVGGSSIWLRYEGQGGMEGDSEAHKVVHNWFTGSE